MASGVSQEDYWSYIGIPYLLIVLFFGLLTLFSMGSASVADKELIDYKIRQLRRATLLQRSS